MKIEDLIKKQTLRPRKETHREAVLAAKRRINHIETCGTVAVRVDGIMRPAETIEEARTIYKRLLKSYVHRFGEEC